MNDKVKKVTPTKVSPIDWKSSFSSHPFVIIQAVAPFEYRIACGNMTDDGSTLTILPSLSFDIDDMLKILEGCLQKESNFRTELQEYYGEDAQKLNQIKCDFNGIEVVINEQMTAQEAKLNWLRDGLNAGYKNLVLRMTSEEREILEREYAMKEMINKYRREM